MARRSKSDWFTVVATDLFSGCFAAVLILDSVTPKETPVQRRTANVEVEYSLPPSRGSSCFGPSAIGVTFQDAAGSQFSTLDMAPNWTPDGQVCRLTGLLDIAEGTTTAREPRVFVGEYDPTAETGLCVEIRAPGLVPTRIKADGTPCEPR
jgi:hypothetical protein